MSYADFNTPASHYFELGHSCGYQDGYLQGTKDCIEYDMLLTKSEIDIILKVMTENIWRVESKISVTKDQVNYLYEGCDKNDPNTSICYSRYKYHKTRLSRLQKQRKKLAVIQGKLKKLRSV